MIKKLKLFQTDSEYVAFTGTSEFVKPNVSHCVNEDHVHYNPHTFADEYFTTIARESGTISFNIWKSMGTDMITSISYSTDNGETWTTTANTDNKTANLVIGVSVSEGDKVMWKSDATQLGRYDDDNSDNVGSFFSSTCEFDAQGNVMSLLYGDDFKSETTIENNYAFCHLFHDYDDGKECLVVNTKNLSLPATTLAGSCYYYMFSNCGSLTTAPSVLPATTLADSCYQGMFYGCTNLTTAPELPATTLASYCYQRMFRGCTSLTTAPELPATTLANYCYYAMFSGCTNLNSITCLATDISATNCRSGWVSGVAANGTFTKAASMTSWTTGTNGIPSNWTVQNAT